jgi:hypothetical protein
MLPVQSLIRPDIMPAVDLAEGSKDRTKPNASGHPAPALEAASAVFGTTNSKMVFSGAARSSSLALVSGPTALAPSGGGQMAAERTATPRLLPPKGGRRCPAPFGKTRRRLQVVEGSRLGPACSGGNSNLKPCDGFRRSRESTDDKSAADRG